MVKQIPVSNGKAYALVDDEDYEAVSAFKWRLAAGYAKNSKSNGKINGKRVFIETFMHRLVNNTPKNLYTDHINGNPLDNRRCNLRNATAQDNQRNHKKRVTPTSSKYKGVSWDGINQKWRCAIKVSGKSFHLGRFSSEEDAALAYNNAAARSFGEYARLNTNQRKTA